MYQLHNAFGGYCDKQNALDSVFGDGVTRNPRRDGGCVPGAPGNTTVTAIGEGNVTVSWEAPDGDGGWPIEGYGVQWKSGSEEYDPSRQAEVTDLDNLTHTIGGLTHGVAYTARAKTSSRPACCRQAVARGPDDDRQARLILSRPALRPLAKPLR